MTKIQGSPSAGSVTPQTEVQQTTTPQAPTSSGQSSEQSPAASAISPRDVAQRRAEHSLGGLAQEAQLRGRISSASKDSKQDPAAQAHQMMQNGQYRQAADTLREHIRTATSVTADRLRPMLNQAGILANMQARGVQNIQHPPTQQNVTDYFRTFRGQPIQTIERGFEDFVNAYFEHSASGSMQIGDRRRPENWQDITSMRRSNGRHQIDCEGYAYLGNVALSAAGFSRILFADMRPGNGSDRHGVVSAIRRQGQSTEVALISNQDFRIGSPQRGESSADARLRMLQQEYGRIIQQPYGIHLRDRIVQDADMERAYNGR